MCTAKARHPSREDLLQERFLEAWAELDELTKDLQSTDRLTTGELLDYINNHLPDTKPLSKQNIAYWCRAQLLQPVHQDNSQDRRYAWVYPADQVRRAMFVQLMRRDPSVKLRQIRRWLDSRAWGHTSAQPTPLQPNRLAYNIVRSRALATMLFALAQGCMERIPSECLVAIRRADHADHPPVQMEWPMAKKLLAELEWHLAANFNSGPLYLYSSLAELLKRSSNPASFESYRWYQLFLRAGDASEYQADYQVVVAFPPPAGAHPAITTLDDCLQKAEKQPGPISLARHTGLALLLHAAFGREQVVQRETTLDALAEIIACASKKWQYCAILVPEAHSSEQKRWLSIRAYSQGFPPQLVDKQVEIGRFLSGWCFAHYRPARVDWTIDNDVRIAYFEDENCRSAMVVPAGIRRASSGHPEGVVYVAHNSEPTQPGDHYTKEEESGLYLLATVCGEVLRRQDAEQGALEVMRTRVLRADQALRHFETLESLLTAPVCAALEAGNGNTGVKKWVHLITVQIPSQSVDGLTGSEKSEWLRNQLKGWIGDFLAEMLDGRTHHLSADVGLHSPQDGHFVYAIQQPVTVSEERLKDQVVRLRKKLAELDFRELDAKFWLWWLSFPTTTLQRWQKNPGSVLEQLVKRARQALRTTPYINRGHDALRAHNLSAAEQEFLDGLTLEPNSAYLRKHLAQVYLLQGNLEKARGQAEIAVQDPDYDAALGLLADCLALQGNVVGNLEEAQDKYKQALQLNPGRVDYLIRNGIASACAASGDSNTAFEVFTQVRQLWDSGTDPDKRAKQQAQLRIHTGLAYMQAGEYKKAMQELQAGRQLAPDDLILLHLYACARHKALTEAVKLAPIG